MFNLSLGPEKLADLHAALNRALNAWEDRPEWLVQLCDNIEKQKPPAVVLGSDEMLAQLEAAVPRRSFELKPYQRCFIESLSSAKAVGTAVHAAVIDEVDTLLSEHLPDWAESRINPHHDGYAYERAQLCTRDGRRMGNAVIVKKEHLTEWVYTVLTDMGTELIMNYAELVDAFYPPKWVMKPEAVGVRLKACVNEDETLEMNAARATLLRMNYEWHGGELWAPPLGAKGARMAVTVLATELGDALIADGWRDPGKISFGENVSAWLKKVTAEYLGRGLQPAEKAVRGEAPGGGLPDWPEDLTTYEARATYQRGVADGRIGWQRAEPLPRSTIVSYGTDDAGKVVFTSSRSTSDASADHTVMETALELVHVIKLRDGQITPPEFYKLVVGVKYTAHPADDPFNMKLPCDITVGHGTHGKGTKLRSLVARMQALYNMSREVTELNVVIQEMVNQVCGCQLIVYKIDGASMSRDEFVAYIDNLKNEHRMRAEGLFPKR